eukprot:480437-Pleurochrysis_carterae.AAC.1
MRVAAAPESVQGVHCATPQKRAHARGQMGGPDMQSGEQNAEASTCGLSTLRSREESRAVQREESRA